MKFIIRHPALREMRGNYLKENNVKVDDGTDVNSIMRDMMSIILEGALDQEMDEELGYSKYDYHNKETDSLMASVNIRKWRKIKSSTSKMMFLFIDRVPQFESLANDWHNFFFAVYQ